ncbi:uncharacterized protein LOC133719728 isoform X2 [Rosa rugosa]|uniref:uncharacterized protein LOC133719728 isoform X2 n=1 Tax=Rosa rugosa TaxID=74645 RepID=UPI002B407C16|nr:uncharacterized protein LOC133719728 isoform X2 [Rosa rugosa]
MGKLRLKNSKKRSQVHKEAYSSLVVSSTGTSPSIPEKAEEDVTQAGARAPSSSDKQLHHTAIKPFSSIKHCSCISLTASSHSCSKPQSNPQIFVPGSENRKLCSQFLVVWGT